MLPDFERADRIGEFWSYPQSCAFAELLPGWMPARSVSDPDLRLFMMYTAVVGSLTEASVLNAVVGKDKSQASLRRRDARGRRVCAERAPARPALNIRSLIRVTKGLRECQERLVDR